MKNLMMFAALSLLSSLSMAGEVAVYRVEKIQSDSIESIIQSAGRSMLNHTRSTGFEACSRVCKSKTDNTIIMLIVSNGSHVGCMPTECDDGFYSEETMHSHPKHLTRFRPNTADEVFLKMRGEALVVMRSNTRIGFSETDYKAGPGYMVDFDGAIWHQNGRGTSRKVMEIK